MIKVGLTGEIAAGKSTVAAYLRSLGAPVVDADETSRSLTAPGGEALADIRRAFGEEVFEGLLLNRKALAGRVFGSEDQRQRLNGIMFPRIVAGVQQALGALADGGAAAAIVDMPLLFQMGFDRQADRLWLCTAPEALRLARLMERDGLTRAQALSRMGSQRLRPGEIAQADLLIDTAQDPEAWREQVRRAWADLLQMAQPPAS